MEEPDRPATPARPNTGPRSTSRHEGHRLTRRWIRAEAGAPAAALAEPDAPGTPVDPRPTDDLVRDAHTVLQQRLRALQELAAAAAAGRLGEQERREGEREAHRVAGAAASFGFPAATVPARDVERLFQGGAPLHSRTLGELQSAVRRLGEALAGPSSPLRTSSSPITGRTLRITVVGGADVEARLRDACRGRDITVTRLGSEPALEHLVVSSPPHVVVLDVADPTTAPGSRQLARLQELAPTSPVLVLAAAEVDRVDLASRGFYGYHDREISGPDLLGECLRVVAVQGAGDVTVLAVDDDELVLATVSASLEPAGLHVVHSDRSSGLLDRLDDIRPDLLVLDLDMPDVDGVQLCEMLRASVKWASLPVVFLTSTTDPDSIDRMFDAGADDYVPKPVLGRELLVRVRNRLDRVQLFRRLAETDPLTGLANRRRCHERVESLLALARRHLQPLSLVVLDLDHFKSVNDTCGHAVGDDVLRGLADMLVEHLRAEDVVGRWGGEEFLIGMYGLGADDAARRLQPLLTEYRTRMSALLPGMTSTFSAGIATYPVEGTTVQQLFVLADERLYEAKEGGRAQIVSGNRPVQAG